MNHKSHGDKPGVSPEQYCGLEGEYKNHGTPINPKIKGTAALKEAFKSPVQDGINADRYKVYGKKHRG
jgi:hypothetical protein